MRASLIAAVLLGAACKQVAPYSPSHIDRSVSGPSEFPLAVEPARVGTYPGPAKSGAGYFYDEVLEYRVWLHPEHGARRLAGDKDYFAAFARYEAAVEYTNKTAGAEMVLVLIRQRESVNEPTPGRYEWDKEERVTEWQPPWLKGAHRERDSIAKFLEEHRDGESARDVGAD